MRLYLVTFGRNRNNITAQSYRSRGLRNTDKERKREEDSETEGKQSRFFQYKIYLSSATSLYTVQGICLLLS